MMMLYLHIPFCERKCAYCDFLSFCANNDEIKTYVDALCVEINQKALALNNSNFQKKVSSIFIGGGTPSILDTKYVDKIMTSVRENFILADDAEITIEANPNSLTKEKLDCYIKNGINRISIGLQSANEDELKVLNRLHSFEQFLNAYNLAGAAGFKNINVDLIKNIPNQTATSFKNTIDKVLELSPEHISVYDLIIEKGTKFYDLFQNKTLFYPSEEEQEKIDDVLFNNLETNDYIKYEISNFAKEGKMCRHNLGYWSDIPYIGLGLGASSYFNNKRYKNETNIKTYIDYWNNAIDDNKSIEDFLYDTSIEKDQLNISKDDAIKNLMNEYMMLSMRTIFGANRKYFSDKFGKSIDTIYGNKIKQYREFIIEDENGFHFTKKGFDLSNQILSDIFI